MTSGRRILILSQVFWPDSSAVSQHMTDLAEALRRREHRVEVLSSRFAYEDPRIRFAAREDRFGVSIRRLWQTGFKKSSRWGRVMNFVTFNASLLTRMFFVRKKKTDLIIGSTVPPLASFFGAIAARVKKIPFAFWAMDLQPELAIVAGYLKKESLSARLLTRMSDAGLKKSSLIIALDRFMAEHMKNRVGPSARIVVRSPWPAMNCVYNGPRLENPFRREQDFGDRLVVMYSGNMSVMHPLDTLLQAALSLRNDGRFLFVFIGGGVRKGDIGRFKTEHRLENIRLLPLQDRGRIHVSLGAADIQTVVLGDGCVGLTHPNKIYGAMFVGKPILYIGPRPSHVTEILDRCPGNILISHGESERLAGELNAFAASGAETRDSVGRVNREYAHKNFIPERIQDALVADLISVVP